MTAMLDLALDHAERGYCVLPVDPQSKRAHTKNWTGAKADLAPGFSKDAETIRQWWKQWPDAIPGLRTGSINGLVVIDVDKHGASDGFRALKSLPIKPEETAIVLTPGNGWHVYFKYATPLKSGIVAEGIDLLAEGRQAICPGAIRDGKTYQFVNGHDLSDLQPLPPAILTRLKRTPAQQRLDRASAEIDGVPEGRRHATLRDKAFALAFDVAAGKLDEAEYRARLADMAGRTVPPFDRLSAEDLISSALLKARSKGGRAIAPTPSFVTETEPWDEAVDGGAVIAEAVAALKNYVALTDEQALVASLWTLHSHCPDVAFHSPRLNLYSPTARCGKSTTRRIIAGMVAKPVLGENTSPAVVYHLAETQRPTFLFDEVQSLLSHRNADRPALVSLMCSGFEMTGAVLRMQGEGAAMAPRQFKVFSPLLLCGIGRIGGPLGDRCIPLSLRRKKKDEAIAIFDHELDGPALGEIARKMARWVVDNGDDAKAVLLAREDFPKHWNDRQNDCARPLLKLARAISQDCFDTVRVSLVEVWRSAAATAADDDDNLSQTALEDIRTAFEDIYGEHEREARIAPDSAAVIGSERLCELLVSDPLKPWAVMDRSGRPLTQHRLAKLLKPYGITPQNVGTGRTRGYFWRQFRDAWGRYVRAPP